MVDSSKTASRRKWLRRFFELLLIVAVIVAVRAWQLRDVERGPAPLLSAPDLQGQMQQLVDYQGQPVLVHFWATWCSICRMEEQSVNDVARDYKVLTVATQSGDAEEVATYLQERGLEFPVVLDEDGSWLQRYGVHGVPASFFIDEKGHIRFVEMGYTTEWGMRGRLWWMSK